MEGDAMDPVVHFEMPYVDRERMAKFYGSAFGRRSRMLDGGMGDYVIATTTETDEKGPGKPGSIHGGFYKKNPESQHPSLVIAADDIVRAAGKVMEAGGEVLGGPVDIPGVGRCVSLAGTEGNRSRMLQPVPRDRHASKSG
jgi:predicted enzyme related to lactoylglutathione lyase